MVSELLTNNAVLYFVILLFICVICYVKYYTTSNSNLPPGPYCYPVIGNALDLKGKDIGTYLEECRVKYGDIFRVRFFGHTIIVLSGYEFVRDAFIKNGRLFSARPPISFNLPRGIVFSNGEQWKTNRRFTLHTLRDFGMGKNVLELKIHEEVEAVITEIERFEGKPFDIRSFINCAVSNIIMSITCGKRFTYTDEKFRAYLQNINVLASDPLLFTGYNWFQYIPGDLFGRKATLKSKKAMDDFHDEVIAKHLEEYDGGNIRDLIDAYIKEWRNNMATGLFNREELSDLIRDLFVAGSETTATCLKWGMVYLLRDQELREKLYEELCTNVPSNRLPSVKDKPHLPLLEATVMEILRLGNIIPLGVPHAVSEDCTFRGFQIPKHAFIMANLQSVMYNETIWDDPMSFGPSRFIDDDGAVIHKEQLIPFSIGRRSCPGESLAKMELFLFFSALVQNFKIVPPEGKHPPDLDAIFGVARAPKPFTMRAIKRLK